MIQKNYVIVLLIMIFIGCSDNVNVPDSIELNTWEDSVGYSMGADLGNTLKMREIVFNQEEFNRGFLETISKDSSYAYGANIAASFVLRDVSINSKALLNALTLYTSGDSLVLSNEDIGKTLKKFNDIMREEIETRNAEMMQQSKVKGESYIVKYKKEHPDAVETDSGLIYRVIKEGFGEIPSTEDKVIVHYVGKLVDGTVFDSSINVGEPAAFRITGVIQGWQEALTMMPVGSKWELVIPSILGYGEKRQGSIPGMSTLIFEVELLGIE